METSTSQSYQEVGDQGPARLHWADYLVLASSLVLSSAIGIYYGIKDRKKKSAEEFLMAGRNMPIFPVSFSLFVSWLSAISFIGDPIEIYYYGSVFWIIAIGYILALPIVAHFFAPTLYRAKLTSVYEFLLERYNNHIRLIASLLAAILLMVYLAIALYAPAISLSQMSGMDVRYAVVLLGGICTFYTSLGGMKAVLWSDTFQTMIMVAGLIACLVQGSRAVGGMGRVWQIAEEGGRINFGKFDPNPLVRATFWTYLLGGFFRVFNPYISSQIWVQRYCSLKSVRDMKIAVYLNAPMYALFVSLFSLLGLVMYAYFHECDPVLSGRVQKADQMIPLMVMETLGFLPGIPGLFLATLCSAALSTLSSGQSALAAQTLRDFVNVVYEKKEGLELSDRASNLIAVCLSILYGCINIALAFVVVELRNTTIFALTIKATGSIGAPIGGVFVLAILFPWVDSIIVFISGLLSLTISLWLAIGGLLDPPPPIPGAILPVSVAGCGLYNDSLYITHEMSTLTVTSQYSANFTDMLNSLPSNTSSFQVRDLYRMSPSLFTVLGCVLTVLFGLLFAGIQRCIRGKRSAEMYDYNKGDKSGIFKLRDIPATKDGYLEVPSKS